MSERFIVYGLEGSYPRVFDTSEPVMNDGVHFEDIKGNKIYKTFCDSYDMGNAEMICEALNQYHNGKIKEATDFIFEWGGVDGGHHKQWVLDQVIRILHDDYDGWVKEFCDGEEGPDTYEWDEGIAP